MTYHLFSTDNRAVLGTYASTAEARADLPNQRLACAVISASDLARITMGTVRMPAQIEAEMAARLVQGAAA